MTAPASIGCPGATVPNAQRTLRRCAACAHYQWAGTGMQPLMRQQRDGSWQCPNERARGGPQT